MITIANMSLEELNTVLGWAASEGWNPGLDDADAFFAADSKGFFISKINDLPVAAISVVKQNAANGFLGLYICTPEYRGQGVGWALWQAGMNYLRGMTIGLDGVLEQQDNYRRSGFEFAYRNIRFAGTPTGLSANQTACRPAQPGDLPAMLQLDEAVHGLNRRAFIGNWVNDTQHRHTIVLQHQQTVTGFATIRACEQGHKIGPLIAANREDAHALLSALVAISGATEIVLDVPEPNADALQLAKKTGLQQVFETARMYRGTPPEFHLQRLFGVTTFELG